MAIQYKVFPNLRILYSAEQNNWVLFCERVWGHSPKLEVARSIANNICRANKMSDCTLPNKTIKYCFMRGKWNNNSRGFRNLYINRCWNKFSMTVGLCCFEFISEFNKKRIQHDGYFFVILNLFFNLLNYCFKWHNLDDFLRIILYLKWIKKYLSILRDIFIKSYW